MKGGRWRFDLPNSSPRVSLVFLFFSPQVGPSFPNLFPVEGPQGDWDLGTFVYPGTSTRHHIQGPSTLSSQILVLARRNPGVTEKRVHPLDFLPTINLTLRLISPSLVCEYLSGVVGGTSRGRLVHKWRSRTLPRVGEVHRSLYFFLPSGLHLRSTDPKFTPSTSGSLDVTKQG